MMSKIRDRHMASARLLGWTTGRKAASEVYLSDHAADAIVYGRIHEEDLVDPIRVGSSRFRYEGGERAR